MAKILGQEPSFWPNS